MNDTTTTSMFRVRPDYFFNLEECTASNKGKQQSNPRYKFFNQTHFTAGDVDQFEQYRDATNGQLCIPELKLKKNVFRNTELPPSVYWEKYKDLNALAVDNTFNYLFHKFKKGIFIKIKEGKMHVFLPFSKKNFVNEWGNRIKIDPKYGNLDNFIRDVQTKQGYKFFHKSVNHMTDTWYANNCLVRYEYPIQEGDTNNPVASDMFKVLCEERQIPDMEFFVNRRDFPLLKTDGTEPYNHLYDSHTQPLLSHNYSKYAPVLSMTTTDTHADIPIPTSDDWSRVCRAEGKYFGHTCKRSFDMVGKPWKQRKPVAVFRGASTGCGVTVDTNQRLKLAYISSVTGKDKDGMPLLDAGITEWNIRPRKLQGQPYLQTINTQAMPFRLVPRLTPEQQADYKYIINVDGHVSAFRLSLELFSGSCILKVDSPYKVWYSHLLKPYVHYIPIKADLSDLVEKVKWCKSHDSECEKIANTAKEFAETHLSKKGILDYLQNLLYNIKKVNGVYLYNFISLTDIQSDMEKEYLKNEKVPKGDKIVSLSPDRTFGFLKAVEWLVKNEENFNCAKVLFQNKNTTVKICEIGGYKLLSKEGGNLTHEVFVGKSCINNLAKYIPNFMYIFGMSDNVAYTEYIEGESFRDYLHSPAFRFEEYLTILHQLAMALHVAQRYYGFVHYDLAPWNIILKKYSEPQVIEYPIDNVTIFRVTTKIVPVIIDMGRSHVIHDKTHYGDVFPYNFSSIQDILNILVTSLNEICEGGERGKDVVNLVKLSNFLSGTEYRKRPFVASGRDGLADLRFFLKRAHNYSELLNSPKYELEKKTPIDFIEYLVRTYTYDFPVKVYDKMTYTRFGLSPKCVYNMAFCNTEKERRRALKQSIKDILACNVSSKNRFFDAYAKSVLHTILDNTVKKLGKDMNISQEKSGAVHAIEYDIPDIPVISYTKDTFLLPKKILKKIQSSISLDNDMTENIQLIDTAFLLDTPYSLTDTERIFYGENFRVLLDNVLTLKIKIADSNTIRKISSVLYKDNLEKINEDCKAVEKYKKYYSQILESV